MLQKRRLRMQRKGKKINVSEWIRWIIILGCAAFVITTIVQSRVQRAKVNKKTIVTIGYITNKHTVTGRGNPKIWIDYYFQVNDTIVYGSSCPRYSIGKQLEIGDRIKIRYEEDNPDNNLFHSAPDLPRE